MVNMFSIKISHVKNPFHTNPSLLHSYDVPKIYLHYQTKDFLMKPDTLGFKSLPTIPASTLPSPLSSYAFK